MHHSKSNFVFRLFIIVAFCFVTTHAANAQCQGQTCALNGNGDCYYCANAPGQGCNELFCFICTSTLCGQASRLREQNPLALPSGQLASLPVSGKCTNESSLTLAKQASGMTDGMLFGLFTPVPGPTPLLISASFGHPTLFQKGVLLNSSAKTIVAYRIGWVYGYQDKAPVVDVSTWQNVIEGIKTNETRTISKLSAPTLPSAKGARLVQFFVAEVKFSDGTTWKQPLDKVREIGTAVRSQSVARSLPSSGTTGS
jgi:hypothetical protein